MSQSPHVGLSLVNKAPIGILITFLISVLVNIFLTLNLITLAYAVFGGGLCAAILLAYWLGKGGIFFILGLGMPLLLVLFTPLATLAGLLNLLSGFFFGFFAMLLIYKYFMLKKPSGGG